MGKNISARCAPTAAAATLYIYTHAYTYTYMYEYIHTQILNAMVWVRASAPFALLHAAAAAVSAQSPPSTAVRQNTIKSQVSFAKEPHKRDNILQKSPRHNTIIYCVTSKYISCVTGRFVGSPGGGRWW